jgi:hypothetical protein
MFGNQHLPSIALPDVESLHVLSCQHPEPVANDPIASSSDSDEDSDW